ncbi:hypothetical protein [Orenia marismortui]|uniref:hypothetical protein n=1 Tax=Orenia marismortui TaxID=46469 RepID=UPI000381D04B|nr:hypothetical protein [Orenia marismortui]
MDWNWFFSSIAQCSSAIVGIFGAFIITKVINSQAEYNSRENKIDNFINKSLFLKNKVEDRYFSWYNERKREEKLKKIRNNIRDRKEILSCEEYYIKYNFSIYDDRNQILKDIENIIRETTPDSNYYNAGYSGASVDGGSQLNQNIIDEEEAINKLKVEIIDHTRLLKDFLIQIRGESKKYNLLTYSIISNLILFLIGVIYPLSFLPVGNSFSLSFSFENMINILFSIKGFMLFIVGFIFSAIMIVFLVINIKLNLKVDFDEDKVNKVEIYSDIKNYSPYLKNLIDNMNFIEEYSQAD